MESKTEKETEPDQRPEAKSGDESVARPERRAPEQREKPDGQDIRPRRRGRGRRRPCVMCVDKMTLIDFKDVGFLRRFISDRGRIESRRKSGTCAKHQRALAQAIKRARHLALLPYTAEHVRGSGVNPSR